MTHDVISERQDSRSLSSADPLENDETTLLRIPLRSSLAYIHSSGESTTPLLPLTVIGEAARSGMRKLSQISDGTLRFTEHLQGAPYEQRVAHQGGANAPRGWCVHTIGPGRWWVRDQLCGFAQAALYFWCSPVTSLAERGLTHFEESALKLAIDRLRREHQKGGLEPHLRLIVYLIISENSPPNLTQVQRAQHRVREALQQLGLAHPYQVKLVLSSSGDAALKRTITERAEVLQDAESSPILYPHMFIDDWAVISSGEVTGENEETWAVSQPFALSQVPVTQALYQGVIRASSALNFGPLSPVVATSWFDAIHFCNQLSELLELEPYYQLHQRTSQVHVPDPDGLGIRLPTRAEWCYAACGGRAWPYAGSDLADEVAWSAHNSGSKIHPVARLKHNDFGLYDMSGNLWEWCHEGPQDSELGLLCAGDHHPKWLLGGSWANHPWVFPIGETLTELPSYRDEFMGFRIARNLSERERAHIRGLGDLNAIQHPSSSVHAWRAYDTSTPADSTSSSGDTSQGASVQTTPPQLNSTQTPRED